MENAYREFGRLLRQAREAAGLTQAATAAASGLSRTSVTNIECGRQHVALHHLLSLSRAVGVPPEQLLPRSVDGSLPTSVRRRLKDQLDDDALRELVHTAWKRVNFEISNVTQ